MYHRLRVRVQPRPCRSRHRDRDRVRLPFGPVTVIVVVPAVSAVTTPVAGPTVATVGLLLVYIKGVGVPVVMLLYVAVVVSDSLPPGSIAGLLAVPVLPPVPAGGPAIVSPVTVAAFTVTVTVAVLLPTLFVRV